VTDCLVRYTRGRWAARLPFSNCHIPPAPVVRFLPGKAHQSATAPSLARTRRHHSLAHAQFGRSDTQYGLYNTAL